LRKLDADLLADRTLLLIKFSQSAATLIPSTFFEAGVEKNSIAGQLKLNQDIMLPSLKQSLFKEKL